MYGVNLFGRDFFAGLIDAGLIVIFANDKEAYLRLIFIHLQEFCRGLNRDPHIAILAYVMIACNNSYRWAIKNGPTIFGPSQKLLVSYAIKEQ